MVATLQRNAPRLILVDILCHRRERNFGSAVCQIAYEPWSVRSDTRCQTLRQAGLFVCWGGDEHCSHSDRGPVFLSHATPLRASPQQPGGVGQVRVKHGWRLRKTTVTGRRIQSVTLQLPLSTGMLDHCSGADSHLVGELLNLPG